MTNKTKETEGAARLIRFPADTCRALEAEKRRRPEMTITALVVEAVRRSYGAGGVFAAGGRREVC